METLATIERATRFGRYASRGPTGGGGGLGCCGIFLILMSASMLFWNEGRAVRTYSILYEGSKAVVEITDPNVLDPANEGKLVHLVGVPKSGRKVTDKEFGVTADALKLQRVTQMYQWAERAESHTVKNPDGSTHNEVSYYYDRIWSPQEINSNSFHKPGGHSNPGPLPYKSMQDSSDVVSIGAYEASKNMIEGYFNWWTYKTDGVSVSNITNAEAKRKAKAITGGFYFGDNPSNPVVGDTKMNFRVVLPATITIMAEQSGKSFAPYKGKHAGKNGELFFVEMGNHTAEEIFEAEISQNKFLTWAFRFVGVLIMYFGVGGMLSPLAMVLHAIPLIGRCISNAVMPLLNSVVAGAFSGVVIAVAWLRFHPLAGVSFILAVAGFTFMTVRKAKQMNEEDGAGEGEGGAVEETNPMAEPLLEEGNGEEAAAEEEREEV